MLPFLIPAAMGAGSFLAGLFKNKKSARTSTQTQTGTNTSTTTPTLTPQAQSLYDTILPSITRRLSNPQGLPAGYLENGIQTINETYDASKQGLDNELTSRGLGTSPVAGNVMTNWARGRATDIGKFRNSIPLLDQQLRNESSSQSLADALQALNFGRGSTYSGSTSGTGSMTGAGSALGGGFDELMPMLGWLIGSGRLGGPTSIRPGQGQPGWGVLQ